MTNSNSKDITRTITKSVSKSVTTRSITRSITMHDNILRSRKVMSQYTICRYIMTVLIVYTANYHFMSTHEISCILC